MVPCLKGIDVPIQNMAFETVSGILVFKLLRVKVLKKINFELKVRTLKIQSAGNKPIKLPLKRKVLTSSI